MWEAPVPIFEDEDEDRLIEEFVRLSALHPHHSPTEITAYIFKDLRDPFPRANQAALKWSANLEIKEKIRLAKRDGQNKDIIETKEQLQSRINAVIEDSTLNSQEKKVRIEGYMAIAKLKGWTENDKDDGDKVRPIVVTYGLDPRAAAANHG